MNNIDRLALARDCVWNPKMKGNNILAHYFLDKQVPDIIEY